MILTDNGSQDFENPKPDTYAATCYKIIDIGTQAGEYQGKPTKRRQIIVGWELDEKMSDGRPFVVTKFYTASLSEKSKLRHDLASWRGRDFTAEELAGFDTKNIIGKACLVSLIENDKGKIVVSSVSKLLKGMAPPVLENKLIVLDLDNFDQEVFDSLSDGVKKMIVSSPEYAKAINGPAPADDVPPYTDDDVPAF